MLTITYYVECGTVWEEFPSVRQAINAAYRTESVATVYMAVRDNEGETLLDVITV